MLWPSGVLQDEVDENQVAGDKRHELLEIDRRGSSCPTLFAWNGERYEFVADMLGAAVAGHWIAPGQRDIPRPVEYIKIPAGLVREKSNSHVSQNQRDMGHAIAGAPDGATARTGMSEPHAQEIIEIPLELIDENPYQTRRTFDEAALNELAESIKATGLAQPVVVRPGTNGHYVLVLGERRCRASKLAGKTSVAAIVRPLGNEQAAEMTIVENLQRQDLNCLEQAHAFARLSQEFNLTQEQNYMRLLKLPKAVLDLVGKGKLGFSEARVLLEATPYLDSAGIEQMADNAI